MKKKVFYILFSFILIFYFFNNFCFDPISRFDFEFDNYKLLSCPEKSLVNFIFDNIYLQIDYLFNFKLYEAFFFNKFFLNFYSISFNNIIFLFFSSLSIFSSFLIIFSKNPIHSIFFLIIVFVCVSILLFLLKLEFLPIIFLVVYVGAVSVLFLFIVMMLNIRVIEISENFINYLPIGSFVCFIFFFEIYSLVLIDFDFFNIDNNLNNLIFNNKNISNYLIFEEKYFLKYFYVFEDNTFSILTDEKFNLFSYLYDYLLSDYIITFFNFDIKYILYQNEKGYLTDIKLISSYLYEKNFHSFLISSLILLVAMIGAIVLTLTSDKNFISIKRQEISKQVYRKVNFKLHNN